MTALLIIKIFGTLITTIAAAGIAITAAVSEDLEDKWVKFITILATLLGVSVVTGIWIF